MKDKKQGSDFEDDILKQLEEQDSKQNSEQEKCACGDNCQCEEDCQCHEGQVECECNNGKQCNCTCEGDCHCNSTEHCGCQDEATNSENKTENSSTNENSQTEECACGECSNVEANNNYLADLKRLQAEFDNYRRRMASALGDARRDGFMEAISNFLPALDSFKMATDMITDKNTLMGIKFIEKGILDTLSKMGVEEIDTTGEFNPEYHQAIDTDSEAEGEPNSIVKVASKGFTYNGKVIRYAQVIVKK